MASAGRREGGVPTAASSEFMPVPCLDALFLFFWRRELIPQENWGKTRLAGVSCRVVAVESCCSGVSCVSVPPARVCLPQVTSRSGRCGGSELQRGLCRRPCGRPSGWPRRLQVVMLAGFVLTLSQAGPLTPSETTPLTRGHPTLGPCLLLLWSASFWAWCMGSVLSVRCWEGLAAWFGCH